MLPNDDGLDARLIAAHAAGDGMALADLYSSAANAVEDGDARAFFCTQAYIYALEAGSPLAPELRDKLIAMGRENPIQPAVNPR